MNRELGPPAWTAPGTATLALSFSLSANGDDPLVLDQWGNSYSPSIDTQVTITSSFQSLATLVPSLANSPPGLSSDAGARLVALILPRGNTNTVTAKGASGDATGIPVHVLGFMALAIPAGTSPSLGWVASANTTCRLIVA